MRGDRLASVLQHYMVPPSTTEDGEPHPSVEVAVQLARLEEMATEFETDEDWRSAARLHEIVRELRAAIDDYVDDAIEFTAQGVDGAQPNEAICYVIRNDNTGDIKIGHSINPETRRWALSKASGQPMTILLELEGGSETEGRLHHRFAEWRTEGEWFSPAREIREWIEQEHAKRG